MPVFTYKGVTASGENTRGSITAENLRTARARLREDGVFLTELTEGGSTAAPREPTESGLRTRIHLPSIRRIPPMERCVATRQLATLVVAGVPLLDSLTALVQQIENARLKAVMATVRERVNEGGSLADALVQSGQFDNLYVSMIRAGEESGALGLVLGRVAAPGGHIDGDIEAAITSRLLDRCRAAQHRTKARAHRLVVGNRESGTAGGHRLAVV